MQRSRNGSASGWLRAGRAVAALSLAVLAALPLWSFFGVETLLAARALVVALAVLGLAAPASGLLVCAGLLPLGGPLSAVLGSQAPSSIGEPLVLAFLVGWLVRTAVARGATAGVAGREALAPAMALAAVVTASALVQLNAIRPVIVRSGPFAATAFGSIATDYFQGRATLGPIPAAAVFLEGLGLFAAALATGVRVRGFGTRLLAMVSIGATGVGVFSIVRLVTVSLRQEDAWAALAGHLETIRISAAFPDPNAAGSYFAMGLLAAVGVAVGTQIETPDAGQGVGGRWLGLLWLGAIRCDRNRTLAGRVARRPRRGRRSRGPARSAGPSRAEMAVAKRGARRGPCTGRVDAVRVAAAEPDESHGPSAATRVRHSRRDGAAGRPDDCGASRVRGRGWLLLRAFGRLCLTRVSEGPPTRERAQQLPPGPRGARRRRIRAVRMGPGCGGLAGGPVVARGASAGGGVGAAAGLAAFFLTWLLGHPLLIFEVATAFWLTLGAVAAIAVTEGEAGRPEREPRLLAGEWVALGLAIAVMASAPFRWC